MSKRTARRASYSRMCRWMAVQAIALAGGAVVRAHGHGARGGDGPRRSFDRLAGGFVVGIYADENIEVGVPDGRQVVVQHLPDDAVLAPQRHKDGDAALGSLFQLRIRRPRERLSPP